MEQITVNDATAQTRIDETYEACLKTIKGQANRGQKNFRIQFELANYSDGHRVTDRLEKHGVKVSERGFGSFRLNDGSYRFDISMELAN